MLSWNMSKEDNLLNMKDQGLLKTGSYLYLSKGGYFIDLIRGEISFNWLSDDSGFFCLLRRVIAWRPTFRVIPFVDFS